MVLSITACVRDAAALGDDFGRIMRMKCRWPVVLILSLPLALIFTSCSSSSSLTSGGSGFLWLASQGNATVQAYTIDLSDGALTTNGSATGSGSTPTSILIVPNSSAAFICNSAPGSAGGISAYTINADGTFSPSGSVIPAGPTPMGMAISPAGTFLFVANQGSFDLTQPGAQPGSISVFSVSGTSLAPVAGSPFPTQLPGATIGTGPVSVAVSASGNYLYVANQFSNTVTSFTVSSTGTLTQQNVYSVGLSPSALFVSIAQPPIPAGQYLYVANTGSSNISAFSICDAENANGCSTPNGLLAPVTGSPFPAQPGPIAFAMDPTAAFLYVADEQGNQVSQFSWSSGSGALTPLTPAMVSAGGSPVSLAIRTGVAATSTVAGTDYMYVANLNASSLSIYTLNTTTGQLNVLGSPFTTPSQPSAVIVK
jgi:6-phosphogluconolactonase (cycloisomerase 2 family)